MKATKVRQTFKIDEVPPVAIPPELMVDITKVYFPKLTDKV